MNPPAVQTAELAALACALGAETVPPAEAVSGADW